MQMHFPLYLPNKNPKNQTKKSILMLESKRVKTIAKENRNTIVCSQMFDNRVFTSNSISTYIFTLFLNSF